MRFTQIRETSTSYPVKSTKATGKSILGASILKRQLSRSIKKEEVMEMDEEDVKFEFIDVDDPKKEPM